MSVSVEDVATGTAVTRVEKLAESLQDRVLDTVHVATPVARNGLGSCHTEFNASPGRVPRSGKKNAP